MPSRSPRKASSAANVKANLAAVGITVAPVHSVNDGTLGADGFRVRPKAWGKCATCERKVYYVKVGENCVYHPVREVE